MASLGTINAQGTSGSSYKFELYPVGTTFKQLPGVYIFLKGNAPVYVGESGDLSARFDSHHKAPEIKRNGANQIGVLVEYSREKRLAIERDLLTNHNWPCNG